MLQVLQALWDISEQARLPNCKAKRATVAPAQQAAGAENVAPAAAAALAAVTAAAPKDMPQDYVPTEMLLFCWLGPPSGSTITAFSLQCSEGPPDSNKRPAAGILTAALLAAAAAHLLTAMCVL